MWDQDEMALSNTQSVINLFQSSAIIDIAYNVQKHKFKTIGSFRNRMRNRYIEDMQSKERVTHLGRKDFPGGAFA